MNILVIGGGGREHALCWKIASSPLVDTLYCAPGNGGIVREATCLSLDTSNQEAVITLCKDKAIELVVVGPEAPLVDGLVDALDAAGIKSFGPSKAAAQLEASKGFTKDLCKRHNIPTGAYERFSDSAPAKAYLDNFEAPYVIKADGLAAGKGVIIAESRAEAEAAIDDILGGAFGAAGNELVIEEFLRGEEASFFALTDGTHILPLATAQDHKRVGEGDTGLNTGGMGAYSPAPVMTDAMCDRVMDEIIRPTVDGMAAEGMPYKGVLYAGLMITETGPQLIEYNVRFGDPECQVLMMRMTSDLVPLMMACAEGTLNTQTCQWTEDVAITVVMAAEGYPGSYDKGTVIDGVTQAARETDAQIFHAGTALSEEGVLTATGGRVLNITALGPSVSDAAARAYSAVDKIAWPQGFCRRDIGWRAIEREG